MIKEDRASRWINLLKLDLSRNPLKDMTEDFKRNHPDQLQIHRDVEEIYKQWPMFQEPELKEYLELLLTFYCKEKRLAYTPGLHEVLGAFFLIGFSSLKIVYAAFSAFVKRMIPRVFSLSSSLDSAFKLFHKLLMYHEPSLCSSLDGKMLFPQTYAEHWFRTLFARSMNVSLLIALWEFCLQERNPTLPFFVALVIVTRKKEQLLSKKTLTQADLKVFDVFINDLEELDSLCQEALALQSQTPESFIKLMEELYVNKHPPDSKAVHTLEHAVCLPISPIDFNKPRSGLFVIDLRESKEFLNGHYPQSFNFPKELELSTEDFWHVLTGFSNHFTNKTNRPAHFAFCYGQKKRAQQQAGTLALDVIRRGVERVSMITEGFAGDSKHDWEQCQWCELNRDLVISSTSSSKKCSLVLSTMWQAFLHEPASLHSSNPSSPRVLESSQQKVNLLLSEHKPISAGNHVDMDTDWEEVGVYVKKIWTNQLEEGEQWFDERRSYDAKSALHWAEAGLLRALLVGDKHSRKIALERFQYAEKVAEAAVKSLESIGKKLGKVRSKSLPAGQLLQYIKEGQKLRTNLSVLCEIFLFKAASEVMHKEYPRGSIHFRNAWKLHKQVIELTKTHEEFFSCLPANLQNKVSAKLELDIESFSLFEEGVFLIAMSMAPPSLVRLASLAGMEADQSKGLKLLYKCINSKHGVRVPASLMFILFWLLVYIPEFVPGKNERYKEASEILAFGNHYFPNSIYFAWLASYKNSKQGQIEKALKQLYKANTLCAGVSAPRLLFERGWLLFLLQHWEQSLECLLAASDLCVPTPFAQVLLGCCSCMMGQLDQAEDWFNGISSHKDPVERWISKRVRRFLARRWFQLFPYELMYITDSFYSMSKDWVDSALSFLNGIGLPELPEASKMGRGQYQEVDECALLLLLKGCMLRCYGRLKEGVECLEAAVSYQSWVLNEKWIIPHAYYELGIIYMRGRDWKFAKEQFLKAKMHRSHEFKRSLNFKLTAALDYISGEEVKEK